MPSIGSRLREERERLGLSQQELASIGKVTRESQGNYESGKRFPKGDYWSAIAVVGIDLQYVLTEVRSNNLDEVIGHLANIHLQNTNVNDKICDALHLIQQLAERQRIYIEELETYIEHKHTETQPK